MIERANILTAYQLGMIDFVEALRRLKSLNKKQV